MAVEFQHSPISLSERISREEIYRRMFWIVDGTRRQNDWTQFTRNWQYSDPSPENSLKRLVGKGRCALLRDWEDSKVPVFFDFGQSMIWSLAPVRAGWRLIVGLTSRNSLVAAIQQGELPKMLRPKTEATNPPSTAISKHTRPSEAQRF